MKKNINIFIMISVAVLACLQLQGSQAVERSMLNPQEQIKKFKSQIDEKINDEFNWYQLEDYDKARDLLNSLADFIHELNTTNSEKKELRNELEEKDFWETALLLREADNFVNDLHKGLPAGKFLSDNDKYATKSEFLNLKKNLYNIYEVEKKDYGKIAILSQNRWWGGFSYSEPQDDPLRDMLALSFSLSAVKHSIPGIQTKIEKFKKNMEKELSKNLNLYYKPDLFAVRLNLIDSIIYFIDKLNEIDKNKDKSLLKKDDFFAMVSMLETVYFFIEKWTKKLPNRLQEYAKGIEENTKENFLNLKINLYKIYNIQIKKDDKITVLGINYPDQLANILPDPVVKAKKERALAKALKQKAQEETEKNVPLLSYIKNLAQEGLKRTLPSEKEPVKHSIPDVQAKIEKLKEKMNKKLNEDFTEYSWENFYNANDVMRSVTKFIIEHNKINQEKGKRLLKKDDFFAIVSMLKTAYNFIKIWAEKLPNKFIREGKEIEKSTKKELLNLKDNLYEIYDIQNKKDGKITVLGIDYPNPLASLLPDLDVKKMKKKAELKEQIAKTIQQKAEKADTSSMPEYIRKFWQKK